MAPDWITETTREDTRFRWQFRLRTLLLATLFLAVGMSCYKSYRWYYQDAWRDDEFVTKRFGRTCNDDVLKVVNGFAYSERGRRLLDTMGASDESRPCASNCDAVLTVENESCVRMRAYVFTVGNEMLHSLPSPICVITDHSHRLLHWFRLGGIRDHVHSKEFSFVREGDRYILTVDSVCWPQMNVRTIFTYTLTSESLQSVKRQDDVPVTPEWQNRVSGRDKAGTGVITDISNATYK